ncbi:MAG: NTP transferase domain-containing protein [Clostridiales bacterium]|nr:NTP transferase domain-containing protein [Clostridiales bacterium]
MMMSKCFELLCALEQSKAGLATAQAAEHTHLPVSEVQPALHTMQADELVCCSDGTWTITSHGLNWLSPYRVKRAVILAAGLGSRLRPVTDRIPKPMIPVKGTRIIDTILDALIAAKINEIHIIRGYRAEAFDALLEKYSNLIFTDNPLYASANNLFSLLYAKDWLQNAYVLDADLYLFTPTLIRKYEYHTNYLACWCEHTDEWCFAHEGLRIKSFSIGGDRCYRMFGLSYWDEDDGLRLAADLEKAAHSPLARTFYWDEVPLRICKENYRIKLRKCAADDILEIDTLEELAALDPAYRPYLSDSPPVRKAPAR